MTQIDEPNLDKIDQEITDILLEHLVLANDNGQPYIQYTDVAVDKIITLIANQVREAVKEEKSIRAKLVTKAHKDGIADGLHMALYGVKDGSKEEKFIRHLLYSENIGNKE